MAAACTMEQLKAYCPPLKQLKGYYPRIIQRPAIIVQEAAPLVYVNGTLLEKKNIYGFEYNVQLDVLEVASLADGVKIPQICSSQHQGTLVKVLQLHPNGRPYYTGQRVKQEQPLYSLDGDTSILQRRAMHWDANDILPNCVNEAVNHLELGPLGAADTHPVAAIVDVTGIIASGGLDSVAAPDTRIPIADPSDSDEDNNSGGNRDGVGRGHSRGRGRGAFRDFAIGFFFVLLGMVSQIVPGLMQLADRTDRNNLKPLILCINMSAAGCFLSSSCGLLGMVIRMLDCRLFSSSSLQKIQNISLITAGTLMMVAMITVLVFVPVAMS